jgi:pantothenate kinase-related protein Tda10
MLSKWIHVAIDTLSNVDFNVCFLRVDYLETVETRKENKTQLESYIQRKLFEIYKKLFKKINSLFFFIAPDSLSFLIFSFL